MRAGWCWLVVLVGCVQAGDVPCGDRVCPKDTICESVTLTCITQAQDTVCSEGDGIDDGDVCSGLDFVGICQRHKCLPGCGDGAVNTAAESCDDGNFRSHDGCSSSCVVETLSWEKQVDPWTGMFGHVAAYHPGSSPNIDAYNGAIVLLTGQSQTGLRTEQWIARRDGAAFILDTPTKLPSPRNGATMAYDAARNKLVLFGGRDANYLNDTWEWDFVNGWVERSDLTTKPAARESAQVAYDTAHQRLVLFGGFNNTDGFLDDTWEYNGTAWVLRTPSTHPSGRVKHAMAYDESRDRVVLYGGIIFATLTLSDQWEYDNGVWTQVSFGTNPGKRSGAAMGYTADRKIVLFGGFTETATGAGTLANDTWQYNGSSWTQVASIVSPPARSTATLTPASPVNAVAGSGVPFQLLLIGGEQAEGKPALADIWRLTPNGWVDISPHGLPPARQGAPAVYDDRTQTIHVFGGIGLNERNDVWSYEDGEWHQPQKNGFVSHYFHAAGYDPVRDRIVMFGGLKGTSSITFSNDTYESAADNQFDWYQANPTVKPSPRYSGVLAWDGSTLVLFGGNVNGALVDETWTYDGSTWTQETKSGAWPAPSSQAAAAYDYVHDRLVLFDRNGATWAHANHAWTKLVEPASGTVIAPPARDDASMTFDWQTKRLIMTGGRQQSMDLLVDVWELDGATWRQLDLFQAGPLPRALFGFASSPFTRESILVGGTATGGQPADDVWSLQYRAFDVVDEDCKNGMDDDGDLHTDNDDPDCCAFDVPSTCLER